MLSKCLPQGAQTIPILGIRWQPLWKHTFIWPKIKTNWYYISIDDISELTLTSILWLHKCLMCVISFTISLLGYNENSHFRQQAIFPRQLLQFVIEFGWIFNNIYSTNTVAVKYYRLGHLPSCLPINCC